MTREQLKRLLDENILLLSSRPDGREDLEEFYDEEMDCGANVLFAPDFHACGFDRESLVRTVAAAGDKAFAVCRFLPPEGGLKLYGGARSFDDYYGVIRALTSQCEQAGASFLILGGFSNLTEAKCAVLAAREGCQLPLCVGLRFDENMRLEGGIDPVMAVITLQSLGVSAVGPMGLDADETGEALFQLKEFSTVPLLALPAVSNAVTPEDLGDYAEGYVGNQCALIGTENGRAVHTAAISKALWQLEPFRPSFHDVPAITGPGGVAFYDFKNQRIGDERHLLEISLEKEKDVEPVLRRLIAARTPPVCFRSRNLDALELAMKLYPGRPAVRTDEYGEIAAKEYGAFVLPEGE